MLTCRWRTRTHAELLVHTGQPYVVTSEGEGAAPPVPWTIDNKYYTAHVHFRVIPHTAYTPGQAQAVLFLLHKDDVRAPASAPVHMSPVRSLKHARASSRDTGGRAGDAAAPSAL